MEAQGGPDAIVGLRDLLDKSKRQKEAAAEQEKEALLNGLAQLAAAQHLQESRIAAQEEQITALKAQIYKGVDFQVKSVEERINAKLPELTQKIEQRLDKVESSLGESFHAIETLISSLSAGKRKARDLLVAQAVTAFSHVSVHMTDEQRVTLVQKRVRGFLRRKRIAAREDATARALAELAAFKETTKRELEEAARLRDAERDAELQARDHQRDAAQQARDADRDEQLRREGEAMVREREALAAEREALQRERDDDARARDEERAAAAREREEERAAAQRAREEDIARLEALAEEREAAAAGGAADARAELERARAEAREEAERARAEAKEEAERARAESERARAEAKAEADRARAESSEAQAEAKAEAERARLFASAEAGRAKAEAIERENALKRSADLAKAEAARARVEALEREERAAREAAEARAEAAAAKGASDDLVNFLKQHPDLEKEVADDGCVEQRLIDFEKRCADAFFRLEQMVELRAAQSLELEKRIQAIASGEERIAGRSRGPSRVSTAKKSVIPKKAAEARKARAKAAAEKEVAAFKEEFLSAARQCFRLIDKDCGGSLSKAEIVEAVKSDQEVITFLTTCGEENLQFLLHPPRLQKALEILDTDKSGEVDESEWDEAIQRGLSKRLEQLAAEQERRAKAAAAADEEFSVEFLNAARAVFRMIDADGSGTLEKAEVVDAVKNNQKVIKFLETCGNPNLQYLLVPARLESALQQLDTDRDGHIDESEWEECIEVALSAKLEQREAKREAQAKAAAAEVAAFTLDFKNAARRCFELIDKDEGGTLDKGEIVRAVKEDQEVISFLETCGEENLQFLLVPDRLEASLDALDTSKDGELDIDEWESAINKGLANRLAGLEVEREERDRAELEEECGIEADTYEALPDPAEDATEGLRHDVNNLTHFVDRLSIRCEDFFRRNAGLEEARKREMHDEERRARLACVDALQALRDGVNAARGVEGVTGPELETLDGVCRRTLASLPPRETLLKDRAPGVLKPSALLRVRMAAAALDKVMDATLEEPFARPGALNHARRAAHRLEDADYDAYSTWHAPLANALDAACALLDRHASSSSTSLDVVRLMKRRRRAPEDEHPCSTDEALDEWGRRLDAGKVPDARQWRVVATLSNEDAPEETQEDNWGGSWDERPWTSDPEEIGPVKKDLDLVKAKAELTQRTCLRLDAALEEVVAQMRGGFASKADLQEVEEHLRRLASIQRGTANEIASNKAGLSDYELQLKRVADQVRASQAKTPRFQRLEQCVASVLCHRLATS